MIHTIGKRRQVMPSIRIHLSPYNLPLSPPDPLCTDPSTRPNSGSLDQDVSLPCLIAPMFGDDHPRIWRHLTGADRCKGRRLFLFANYRQWRDGPINHVDGTLKYRVGLSMGG